MAIDPNWVRENPEEAARQIELLTKERDQYRAAEEAQNALWEKAALRLSELECQLAEAGRYLRDTGRLALIKQAEALDEAYKHTDDAAAQDYLHDKAAELRQQAEGGA